MNVYFKNIRLINPDKAIDDTFNLWIKEGVIKYIGKGESSLDSDTEIINAENLVAAPGFIDMHAEIGEPGYEYKEDFISGSASAVNGGFTDIVMMPNTEPVIDNAAVIGFIKDKTKDLPVTYHIAGALTQKLEGNHIAEMLEMSDNGAVMFTNGDRSVKSSEVLKHAFDYASSKDLLISVHCEDAALTNNASMNESALSYKLGLKGYPRISEEIIVFRDIKMAEYTGNRKLHIQHISTRNSVEIIKDAKAKDLRVTCEVAPHNFILDESNIESYYTHFKVNPPLRKNDDMQALIEGLKNGTIDVIVSDHKPSALHEKDVEYELAPNGIINLETTVGLSLTYLHHNNNFDLNSLIKLFTVNPRNILGLDQVDIAEDKNAKLTILDTNAEWVVNVSKFKSKATNSPYNGFKLKGKPVYVINNNNFIKTDL